MARVDPTWTQLVIILVTATVPLVYAFTHHGRARENTLALWLPCWLFITRVVYPGMGRWAADAPLELRLKMAAIAAVMDPFTVAWPLLVWVIVFLRRRRRAPGHKDRKSTEATGQGTGGADPAILGAVVFLLIVMLVAAWAADQAVTAALSPQAAAAGTTAADPTWPQIVIVVLAVVAPPAYAFTHHGADRLVSLTVWVPLWLSAAHATYLTPPRWANSIERRLEWTFNELLSEPATIVWPLYVFFVYGLILLFTPARHDAFVQANQGSTTSGVAGALRVVGESPLRPDDAERRSAPSAHTKQCLECGRSVPRDRHQCPYCHYSFAPVPASPPSTPVAAPAPLSDGGEWCSHCGVRVPAEANFCARCGYDLARQR